MKKLKTILGLSIIGILSIICFVLIYVMYNDDGDFDFFNGTTRVNESDTGYNVVSQGDNFISYVINREDMSFIELNINGTYVKFSNEALWIADNLMIQGSELNRNFAVYNDCVLVFPFAYKAKVYGGIVIYNIYTGEFEVVEKLNKMYIDITNVDQIVSFDDAGMSVDLKNVDGNLVMDDGETYNICKYKGKIKTARASIIYLYDKNDKKFDGFEKVSDLPLLDYKISNEYC